MRDIQDFEILRGRNFDTVTDKAQHDAVVGTSCGRSPLTEVEKQDNDEESFIHETFFNFDVSTED